MVCSVKFVSVIDTMHIYNAKLISFFVNTRFALLSSDRIKLVVYTIYENPKFSVVGHFHPTEHVPEPSFCLGQRSVNKDYSKIIFHSAKECLEGKP